VGVAACGAGGVVAGAGVGFAIGVRGLGVGLATGVVFTAGGVAARRLGAALVWACALLREADG
jgi:hypothetical protein